MSKQTEYVIAALGFGYLTLFAGVLSLLTIGIAIYFLIRAYEERNKK